MFDVVQDVKDTAVRFVDVTKQHPPAEPTIQNHQHRRQDRRGAIAHESQNKSM